jgi:hypothetical protein
MKSPLRIKYPKNPLTAEHQQLKGLSEEPTSDYNDYLQRLIKLIPSEAIGIYLTVKNMVPEGQSVCGDHNWLPIVGLIPLLIIRILGTRVQAVSDDGTKPKISVEWGLVLISIVSYFIWIYSIGDCVLGYWPKSEIDPPFIIAIVVMLWTFLIPYIYKPKN